MNTGAYLDAAASYLDEPSREELAAVAASAAGDSTGAARVVWACLADLCRGWATGRDVARRIADLGAAERAHVERAAYRAREDMRAAGDHPFAEVWNAVVCAAADASDDERDVLRRAAAPEGDVTWG